MYGFAVLKRLETAKKTSGFLGVGPELDIPAALGTCDEFGCRRISYLV